MARSRIAEITSSTIMSHVYIPKRKKTPMRISKKQLGSHDVYGRHISRNMPRLCDRYFDSADVGVYSAQIPCNEAIQDKDNRISG